MSAGLLQLKLTLVDVKPPIWRRLVVPNHIALKRLHEIIQLVAGWKDEHPHEFVIAERRYGRPSPREVVPVENEALFRLHSLPLVVETKFAYVYDFGDHWEIEVKVEKVLPPDPRGPSTFVLAGARAFPPENSGGTRGYEALVQALPEEHGQRPASDFDPERFDAGVTNEQLIVLLRDSV